MWRCPKCKGQVNAGTSFCANCGERLSWPTRSPNVEPDVNRWTAAAIGWWSALLMGAYFAAPMLALALKGIVFNDAGFSGLVGALLLPLGLAMAYVCTRLRHLYTVERTAPTKLSIGFAVVGILGFLLFLSAMNGRTS